MHRQDFSSLGPGFQLYDNLLILVILGSSLYP